MTRAELLELLQALEANPDLAARLARALAPHVFMAGASNAKTPERTYSTRKGGKPDGYADEAWRDIAGRLGVRRGRWYYVDAATLETYERGESRPQPATIAKAATPAWHPSQAAEDSGLRIVKGGLR
jgi:hypothetical protein